MVMGSNFPAGTPTLLSKSLPVKLLFVSQGAPLLANLYISLFVVLL
jgi:hypothetical protein